MRGAADGVGGPPKFLQKINNFVELVDFDRGSPALQIFNSLLGFDVGLEIRFRLMAIASGCLRTPLHNN
jgi:hypothetical protein